MGAAGRARIREAFDWPVVARQLNALVDDLAQRRAAAVDPGSRHRLNPVKGDPFADFAGFASAALTPKTALSAAPGATPDQVRQASAVQLDVALGGWRGGLEECARALELVVSGQARTVADVLLAFPVDRRRAVELGLMWLAKHGFLDWPT
jgi:hypothetical protein